MIHCLILPPLSSGCEYFRLVTKLVKEVKNLYRLLKLVNGEKFSIRDLIRTTVIQKNQAIVYFFHTHSQEKEKN